MESDFVERLKTILTHYKLTSAAFADQIGVPRSSISHILSGRNRPSLDFVMKTVRHYPEVNLYWLLNGKGQFPEKTDVAPSAPAPTPLPSPPNPKPIQRSPEKPVARQLSLKPESSLPPKTKKQSNTKHIQRIVIFFDDGSFESFDPTQQ